MQAVAVLEVVAAVIVVFQETVVLMLRKLSQSKQVVTSTDI